MQVMLSILLWVNGTGSECESSKIIVDQFVPWLADPWGHSKITSHGEGDGGMAECDTL